MAFNKTISEIMQEIKQNHTADILNALTEPDKSGKGFVCPICGSGTGKNGTGMTAGTKNPNFFTCWACEFQGDIFDLLKATTHKSDAVELIQEAERILQRQFLDDNKNTVGNRKETLKPAEQVNKNMVQNTVNNLVEQAKQEAESQEQARRNKAFIKQCHTNLPTATDGLEYIKRRGISEDVAMRMGLGYTPKYYGDMNTPAIIFPKYVKGKGNISYTARSIENVEQGRKARHNKGEQGIFNLQVLAEPGAVIFLTEGEFDALSIIECGFPAISTSGNTKADEIVEIIKETTTRPEYFVILPDNDRNPDGSPDESPNKGYSKGLKLADALKRAGIKCLMIDTRNWNPAYKDSNDYLVGDRNGFIAFLRGIAEPIKQEALRTLGRASDYVQNFIDHISGKTAPIDTGFTVVNNLLDGGLHPGLIIVGAISSLGKTTFVLNLADNMASRGQDVIIFSLEMSRYELMAKSVSRKTFEYCKAKKQPVTNARTNLGISDYDRYSNYSNEILNMIDECVQSYEQYIAGNLYLIEGVGNIGIDEIRETVRKFIAVNNGKRPVVVIDYMQILAPADPRSSDKQNTDRAVVEMKRISRDFNLPVIGISSFNRESYSEPVSMKAYKESGAIEYTSDVLIGLQYTGMDYETYTDVNDKLKRENEKDGRRAKRIAELFATNEANAKAGTGIKIDIKVLKNRSGARGTGTITYYPKFNCYREE